MAHGFGLTDDEKATITKIVFQDSIKSIDNDGICHLLKIKQ